MGWKARFGSSNARLAELCRQAPFPTPEKLKASYPADYRPHLVNAGWVSRLKTIQANGQARALSVFLPKRSAPILELGCGSGSLLHSFSRMGYTHLVGMDQNPDLARVFEGTRIQFKSVDLESGSDAVVQGAAESFECVILMNVLEHFLNPAELLKACRALLKPGGKVLILTPNAKSWSHRVFGKYWSGLHSPRHPWVCTPESLRILARDAGLSVTKIRSQNDIATWAISFQNGLSSRFKTARPKKGGTAWYSLLGLPFWYPFAALESLAGRPSSVLAVLTKL